MLRNYFKTAWRNLLKDKQFTLLNVIGLSAGIACTLLIYLWVHDERSYDKGFANGDQIYQIMEHRSSNTSQSLSDESSGLVSDALKAQNSDVLYAAAVAPSDWFQKFTLTVGDKNIKASAQYVGKDYFNIFSFPMIKGDRGKVFFADKSIVLSEDLANRLFGSADNAIGKMVKFQHGDNLAVTGVYQLPVHSSQQFDCAMSFDYLAKQPGQSWVKTWGNGGPHNFVLLKKEANLAGFNNRIEKLITKNTDDTTRFLFASPFANNYLANTFNHGARVGGRGEYVNLFSIIAVFILLIACINFMNLSTAKASGRMKEVGIKKVVGAARSQLIIQFLSESLLLTLFAAVLAVGIAWLLLPQFNTITGKDIKLDFDGPLLLTLGAIILITGLVAGSYPALYLSKFKPLAILKDKLKSSTTELFARKGLVVFQFCLSVMLIVAVLIVYRQIQYIQSTNPGYNKDNIVRFDSEGRSVGHEEQFAEQLRRIPGVVNATYTRHNLVGRNFGTAGVTWEGDLTAKTYFEGFFNGYNFVSTMGMKMAAGRDFSKDFADTNKIIVNETAVKVMHLKNPVGANITLWRQRLQIVGVVKDFHFESLHQAVVPAFMLLNDGGADCKFMVRIKGGADQKETISRIQQFYESYNPGFPFTYSFLDEVYQKQYENEVRISVLSRYFSALAIVISCLGLFGLVAFTAQKRQKEIGIRKVIGASVNTIMMLLIKDFLLLVLIAVLIAFPLAWYGMGQWLQGFAYRISIGPLEFGIAALSVTIITLMTVGFQALKAALVNPVKSLRSE